MTGKCSFCGETKKIIKGQSGNICESCCTITALEFGCGDTAESKEFIKPHQFKKMLDDYVVGQDQAKKALSVAIFNHYKRMKMPNLGIEKSNILLYGPTGCGKTYIVNSLAKMINVPFVNVDATTFTEAGYVGRDVQDILKELYLAADEDVEKAQYGIVYVDEIDKIANTQTKNSSVNNSGVQQAFLKMMEGGTFPVPIDKHGDTLVSISTNNILFVFGGAFNGLTDHSRTHEGFEKERAIGFNTAEPEKKEPEKKITSEDLIKYGFIPEFIGRIPVVVGLKALTQDDFRKILTRPKNAILKQYQQLFGSDGVKVTFSNAFIEDVILDTEKKQIGARGLKSSIEEKMTEIMFELPRYTSIKELEITPELVKNPKRCLAAVEKNKRHSS